METGRESVRARAFAKINLGLEVLGTRADGYHLLRTGMQSISLADELLLTRTAEEGITLRCDEPWLPTDGRNLAVRAAEAVFRHCGLSGGVRIELKKQIPAEAGLGGGSADAAAVLRGLRALFSLPLGDEALRELALPLGADVPFCVGGGTMLAEGIGEVLSPLPPMPPCHLVIVKPPCGSSTKAVYAALSLKALRPWEQPDARLLENALRGQNVTLLGASLQNALEKPATELQPVLLDYRQFLTESGAAGAAMSGSGSAFFAVFPEAERDKAEQCIATGKKQFPAAAFFLCRPVSAEEVSASTI